MTTPPELPASPPPELPPQNHHSAQRIRPWVIGSAIVGSGLVAAGGFGYMAGSQWIRAELPSIIETELSQTINRDVQVGNIEEVSLTGIRVGPSIIPPAPDNPNSLIIPSIKINFNPLQVLTKGLATRTLPIEITIVQPQIYAKQDAQGQWINLDLKDEDEEPTELPVNLDAKIRLQEATVELLPQGQTRPVTIPIDATAQYYQSRNNQARYDAKLEAAGSQIGIKGKTALETGSSQVSARVDELALAQFAPLIPTDVVQLTSGELNANLKIDLPGSDVLPSVFGKVRLQNFQARVATLKQPVKASAIFELEGKTLRFEETAAQLGDLNAQVGGSVNWRDGLEQTRLNLDLDVPPVELATLKQVLPVQVPIDLEGGVTAKARVRGTIKQPQLTAGVQTTKPTKIDKVVFNRIQADVVGDLEQIRLAKFQALPAAGGQIQAQGQVTLPRDLAKLDVMQLPLALDLKANVPAGAIATSYGLTDTIKLGMITAQGQVRGNLNQPQIQGRAQTTQPTQIDRLAFNRIEASLVGDRSRIQLTNFQAIPTDGGQIQAKGQVRLPSDLAKFDVAQLPLSLDFNADLPANAIATTYDVTSTIQPGKLLAQGQVRGTPTNPQALVNWQLPSAYAEAVGTVTGSGKVILANRTIRVQDTLLRAGGGTVTASAQANLDTTQWQAAVDATDVDIAQLPAATTNASDDISQMLLATAPLNSRLRLSGEYSPLLKPQPAATVIRADDVAVTWGQQSLRARGRASLYPPANAKAAWDAAVALNVAANVDFNTLPIERLVQLALADQPIAVESKVRGQASFRGRLVATNLLTNPLASTQSNLMGDVALRNFRVNQLAFDPTITGPVRVDLSQGAMVNLRGPQDRVAATLARCTEARCRIPYLPTTLDVRLGSIADEPLLVQGRRAGDQFAMSVENVELATLGVAPAQSVGVPGVLSGRLSSRLDVNLYTLRTQGQVQVDQPGIGEIRLDQVATRFAYADSQAQIADGQVLFGQSRYDFAGGVNLQSGAVQGKLTLTQGYVSDLLSLFQAYQQQTSTLAQVEQAAQAPPYANAAAVQTEPVGQPNASLAVQLQELAQAEANLPPATPPIEQAPLSAFDAQGNYTGELTVGGTLTNPRAAFLFQGEQWQLLELQRWLSQMQCRSGSPKRQRSMRVVFPRCRSLTNHRNSPRQRISSLYLIAASQK